ncbi:MAG: M1 family metallopeptidase, partial [Eudoraea sp.]|nr:M1 family metallopeptidase [Eudoraea sp.]
SISIQSSDQKITGEATYLFRTSRPIATVFLDAKNMTFHEVRLNNRKVKYLYDGSKLVLDKRFKPGKEYRLELSYACTPKQTVYFLGWDDTIPNNEQIWTQGQGKYSSHWVPSIDDMNEKVVFDMEITFDKNYQVIANGELNETIVKGHLKTWRFNMQHPMSSYLLAFSIGKYHKNEIKSGSGTPMHLYYYPKDSLKVEPTYRYTKEIFDFLEDEIGVSYPWKNYKQIPVRDFLYAGMENTGATIFSDAFMVDSTAFTDKNYVNVNAHELAHQWFGNLVTEVDASSHWLHEGFASYYALLAEKQLFGEDYYYWKLFDLAQQLATHGRKGKGESLTNPKASSTTFYDKGALALLMLREQLGEDAFKEGMRSFLETYRYKNATVVDFISIMEKASKKDLSIFVTAWLEANDFREKEVKGYLRNSSSAVDAYLKLQRELSTSPVANEVVIQRYWESTNSSDLKKRIILAYDKILPDELLIAAFNSGDLQIRQALSLLQGSSLKELAKKYESLLNDKSYVTIENALYTLWIYFPEERVKYLTRTKGIIGFSNKNIRQLWLLLAILTKDFENAKTKAIYRKELLSYTAPHNPMEVRQMAFGLLKEVFWYSDQNLKDLVNAAVHPSWQFRQYANGVLDDLLKNSKEKERLKIIVGDLKGKELEYLTNKLGTE